jgi:hypothetical protein
MRAAAVLAAAMALASGCAREPEVQAFGMALPEPARGLTFVAGGSCNVESVSGTLGDRGWRVDTTKPLRISGWAYEEPSTPSSPWAVVELAAPGDRARYFAATTDRGPLLIAAPGLDGPGVRSAAFDLVARADNLPRGRYVVRVLTRGTAGGLTCETKRPIELV